jgi:predicted TIM-barrel fold metal-dependent hydrolase
MTRRYFDSLVHITRDGRWFNTGFDASEARLLREMDAAGVERAVVVALAGVIDNQFVIERCRRHGDRLIAGMSLDPTAASLAETADRARAELRDTGARVLKLHPRLNRYDILDARVMALLEEMASWNAPPLIWIDSLLFPKGVTMQRSPVDSVRQIAERLPSLKFVLLHGGGANALAFYEAVASLENVTLDLSYSLTRYAGTSLATDHRFLVERFDRRTVWGSDFPEVSLPDAVRGFEALIDGLPDDKVNNVRYQTLATLLP